MCVYVSSLNSQSHAYGVMLWRRGDLTKRSLTWSRMKSSINLTEDTRESGKQEAFPACLQRSDKVQKSRGDIDGGGDDENTHCWPIAAVAKKGGSAQGAKKGFAAMSKERVKEISALGRSKGGGFQNMSEEKRREVAKKGGKAGGSVRGKRKGFAAMPKEKVRHIAHLGGATPRKRKANQLKKETEGEETFEMVNSKETETTYTGSIMLEAKKIETEPLDKASHWQKEPLNVPSWKGNNSLEALFLQKTPNIKK